MSELEQNVLLAFLVFVSAWLMLYSLFGAKNKKALLFEQRFERLTTFDANNKETNQEDKSRDALEKALKELENIQKARGRSYLRQLLKRAGASRSLTGHVLLSVGLGVFFFMVFLGLGLNPLLAVLSSVLAGFSLPILQLRYVARKRLKIFADDLPGALDLVVRGIRAGLPLSEGFKMVATEWRDPLGAEFSKIIKDLNVGLSVKDAVGRFAERVPLQEAQLFAIVIAIQSQAGGNLSEILSNLSFLLRERAKLNERIKSMTSEARTSALIIGSIPPLLMGAVKLLSPEFLDPLFYTSAGHLVLLGSAIWMGMGVLVMRTMMKVDI